MRARLLLALVATSALTLLAAAATLLSPLQTHLRQQTRRSLQAAVQSARPEVVAALKRNDDFAASEIAGRLHTRTSADVTLFKFVDSQLEVVDGQAVSGPDKDDDPALLYQLYVADHPATVTKQSGSNVAITVPLLTRSNRLDLMVVHKQDTDLDEIVSAVRNAFLTAALVGLAIAVLLGLILSATLSRRLGRLRATAQRIVAEGADAPAPVDRRRDDVGDLARAMAEMQVAIRRQEEARRQFVATASHELRTPLTSLMGTLELLAEDLDYDEFNRGDAQAQVRGAQEDLERLRGLATELLDLSRLDAGIELRSEPVELGELARAVVAEFAAAAAKRDVTLAAVTESRGPCWAQGDPGAVARIVRILIDNALRYTPRGSRVEVVSAYEGDRVVVSVSDNGTGVPEVDREAVFERFQRGTTARTPGFGLGLAIGRELARQLNGELALDAEHMPGARFVLTLPIELPGRDGQTDDPESGSRSYSVDGGVL